LIKRYKSTEEQPRRWPEEYSRRNVLKPFYGLLLVARAEKLNRCENFHERPIALYPATQV
jgi:hypothetical protein